MRNGYRTFHSVTCRLFSRYVYLTQSLISLMLWFILLSTPTDPHTAWIDSSTLLEVCAHSCKIHGSTKSYFYCLGNLLNLHNLLNPYTEQVSLTYSIYETTKGRLSTTQLLQTQQLTKISMLHKCQPIPACESIGIH